MPLGFIYACLRIQNLKILNSDSECHNNNNSPSNLNLPAHFEMKHCSKLMINTRLSIVPTPHRGSIHTHMNGFKRIQYNCNLTICKTCCRPPVLNPVIMGTSVFCYFCIIVVTASALTLVKFRLTSTTCQTTKRAMASNIKSGGLLLKVGTYSLCIALRKTLPDYSNIIPKISKYMLHSYNDTYTLQCKAVH